MLISRRSLSVAVDSARPWPAAPCRGVAQAETKLLNVSYDPTRELYKEFNAAFAAHWKKETGEDLSIEASHGGSGKQARAGDRRARSRRRHPGAGL